MRKFFLAVLILTFLYSCKTAEYNSKKTVKTIYESVQIDTLIQDKISIRAIVIDGNKIWYAGDNSKFGFFDLEKNNRKEFTVGTDKSKAEFRSIAQTKKNIFILNVANPALLYKIPKDGSEIKLVYQENHEKVFFDSMQFWNNTDGIAMGDPINSCLNIIITHDGGNSWRKIPCNKFPKLAEGEAAFAASNTNIIIKGSKTWIVSGGKKARVFYSPDKGNSWEVFDTPIIQGKTMTGIFTVAFYDSKNGFIAGGNYEMLNQNFGNKALTKDGGKTWELRAENQGFGYASCIQYVPDSNGKELVTVGASGLYYSYDSGNSWKQLSTDSSLYTIRFINNYTAIAAGKNKIIRIKFKN